MKGNLELCEKEYCRACLNEKYNLNLQRRDVRIHLYPSECAACGNVKNIVCGVRFISRWKLWFSRKFQKYA